MTGQRKVFYGWWIILALLVVGMVGPMARHSLASFFPFISSELGWSRSTIGLAQSATLWTYAILSPLAGWMIDRLGSRKTILIGGLTCLIGWLLFSTIRSLWQLFLYYGVLMALPVSLTFLVPLQATSRKWFVKRGGLVSGILAGFVAAGASVFSPLLTNASSAFGWRTTSVASAFAFGIPIVLLAFFVIRDTPESMGLHPDGEGDTPAYNNSKAFTETSWTVAEAVRAPQLWLMLISYSMQTIPFLGMINHVVIWGVDLGSTKAAAGIFTTALFAPSVASRILGGYLGDRFGKRRVIVVSNVFCTLLMLWAWQGVRGTNSLLFLAMALGFFFGFAVGLYAAYLGDLFGRANVGSLFGIITMGLGFIAGSAPVIWGKTFEISGGYNLACLISAGACAIATIAAFLIHPTAAKVRQAA